MKNSYLVLMRVDCGDCVAEIMTPDRIFDMMDMSDCYDIDIDVYRIIDFGFEPEPCTFYGTWSDPSDPLKMWIEGDDGTVYDVGHGTDH